ncbi:MAG: phosphoglycerate kinase [Candidatus Poseidoniia archaeon]|nr:phosphoglycerate kinase [Candidatus Poseidoniia archaeon]
MGQNSGYTTVDGEFDTLKDRSFLTIDDFKIEGKVIILRIDINSSVNPENGDILDNTRIKRHAETVKELSEKKAKTIILAHQSRPGKLDFISLEKHAKMMAEIININIDFIPDLYGKKAIDSIKKMNDGQIIMLENVRFDKEEIKLNTFENDNFEKQAKSKMVTKLSPLADLFVNDAFAAAHRCQPSLVGFAEELPALAGRVMQRELDFLGKAIASGPQPRIAVLGGSKAADSVLISEYFLKKGVRYILTGGVVANIFLMAEGIDIGVSSTNYIKKNIPNYKIIISKAKKLLKKYREQIIYPNDVALNKEGKRIGIHTESLPTKYPIHDIGLDTLVKYIEYIDKAGTIIANGPMGVFENTQFAIGTKEVFEAISNNPNMTVVGGGETAMAFNQMGLTSKIEHVSTGGGACIAFMADETMPALEAMRRSKIKYNNK